MMTKPLDREKVIRYFDSVLNDMYGLYKESKSKQEDLVLGKVIEITKLIRKPFIDGKFSQEDQTNDR